MMKKSKVMHHEIKLLTDEFQKFFEEHSKGEDGMTQEERWLIRYNEVIAFIDYNFRNPSKHRFEENDLLNWLKANMKRMNAGEMTDCVASLHYCK